MSEKETIVKRNSARFSFVDWRLSGAIVLLIIVFLCTACYEEDMKISLDQRLPPTFRLSGSGNLVFFGVWEVAPENQNRLPSERNGDKDTILWKIWPNGLNPDEKVIRHLPPITYGAVPPGFVQMVPKDGAPPNLIEGRVYRAGGPATNANGGFVMFSIQSGRVVMVDEPSGN